MFPNLERCLLTWFKESRDQNVPIGGNILKEKALRYAESLGIKDFKASEGWLTNFKKRHGLSFRKLCGESAAVEDEVCDEWRADLKDILKNYAPRDIFNADETALFFKCLPDKTMTYKNEKCHGGKLSKERVTLLFATNMDGSEKLRPVMIGKSAKPRCFKNIKSFPMTYKSNKKAWITTDLFNEWLLCVNKQMKSQSRKILMFVDNCSAHTKPPPGLDCVEVRFLPANTTSKLQPLDQGIIQNFKVFYRSEIVKLTLDHLERGEQPIISILTALTQGSKAWKNITSSTIANCFRKAGFVKEDDDRATRQHDDENVESFDVQAKWRIVAPTDGISFIEFANMDEDVEVCGRLSDSDILEGETSTKNVEQDNDQDDDDTEELEPSPISSKDAVECFKKLRSFLQQQDNINDETFSALFKIENEIDRVLYSNQKQTKITDFFTDRVN